MEEKSVSLKGRGTFGSITLEAMAQRKPYAYLKRRKGQSGILAHAIL